MARDAAGVWRYYDTGRPVSEDPARACGHCGLPATAEGHDGCLGEVPGAVNACCGHGVEGDAYVQYPGGADLSGRAALAMLSERRRSAGGGRR